MDWKTLFLSAKGRIGRRDFWLGFLVLFVAGFIVQMIPVIGPLIGLAMIYVWTCLYSKRLHDFGKSGWLCLAPMLVMLVALAISVAAGGAAMMAAGTNPEAPGTVAGMGVVAAAIGLAGLFGLAFLLWVGLSKSDPAENRYGPPATTLVTAL